MSSANWRNVFTYNKYTQICARALRQSLNESSRAEAEKRGLTALRYQNWEDGKSSPAVYLNPPDDHSKPKTAGA